MKDQILKVKIYNKTALAELIENFGLYKFANLQTVLRQVTKKFLSEYDEVEFFIGFELLRKCYQKNPKSFADLWSRHADYRIFVQKSGSGQALHFRVGYDVESFCFITNLAKKLSPKNIRSVDVRADDIPRGYKHDLTNKLTKKLKTKIKRIDLGEVIRFHKPLK